MSIKTVAVIVLLCCTVSRMEAQAVSKPADPVFVRAQAMVSDGNGVAGRALIDSVIAATPPMAPLYPQALFWRASLAASAADAESDYKHIVVDYPLAPQAADALLRLAQLELARGDRDGALAHLQRIPRDYPRSKSLARASYWTARVLFEKNDIPHACAANESALSQADTTEIELRNQIQYQGQRCPSGPAVAAASPPAAAATAPNSTSPTASSARPPSEASVLPSTAASVPSVPTAATTMPGNMHAGANKDTARVEAESVETRDARPRPPAEANDTKPSIVDPTKAPKATAEKAPEKGAITNASSTGYSVQV